MKVFAKVVVSHLSPAVYDVVCGIGLGYDPAPREYRETFIDSDLAAFIADTEALYLDWCSVHDTIVHHSTHMTETRHHGRVPKSGRRERREEHVA